MSEYTTYIEIPVTVYYDHQPEEKAVMYPNDKAYPGAPETVSLCAVETEGKIDIIAELDGGIQQGLVDEIFESLRGDE